MSKPQPLPAPGANCQMKLIGKTGKHAGRKMAYPLIRGVLSMEWSVIVLCDAHASEDAR